MSDRSPLAKLAIVIALTLALILALLLCMWLFVPQDQARLPQPTSIPVLAPETKSPLVAPEPEASSAPLLPQPAATLEAEEPHAIPGHAAAGCRLIGTIRDVEKRPVGGQELWLLRADPAQRLYFAEGDREMAVYLSESDAEGHFNFYGVKPGSWRLGPAARDTYRRDDSAAFAKAVVPRVTQVEIADDTTDQAVDLVVYRGLTIRGTVLDANDLPSSRGLVSGWLDPLFVQAPPQADGTFILGPLVPGTWELRADSCGEAASSEIVRAEAGATAVVLRRRPGATLTGHVVDAITGRGCSAWIVQSYPEDPLAEPSLQETWPDGTFKLEALLLGRVALAAATKDGRTGVLPDLRLASGEKLEVVTMYVSPGVKLRVRYEGKSPWGVLRVVREGIIVESGDVQRGTTQTFRMPAGELHVAFYISGKKEWLKRELTLAAGEERELVFKDDD